MKTISSRTPEGWPNQCPVCSKSLTIEPSTPFGDATCPHCGSLLWFVSGEPKTHYFEYEAAAPVRERIRQLLAEHAGISLDKLPDDVRDVNFQELGLDSLDIVELVMELEEELD
jgi:acyl carrier protein